MRTMFKLLTSAAFFGAAMATQVSAELRYDTGNGGTVQVYGQFSPVYLSFDDGVSVTSAIVDNTNSNSRIGLWYKTPLETGEFSINLETSFGLRSSGALHQESSLDDIDWQRTSIRKVEAIWSDNRFGTFSIGQGSMSADGASAKDLSGTGLVLNNSIPDTAGAFSFRTKAGDISTKTIGQAFATFDGSRRARIRYDTPSLNGVSLSVSYGEEVLNEDVDLTSTDFGLSYAGQVGSVTMVGGLAYSRTDRSALGLTHDIIGSFSLLHETGFNVTVAAGNRDDAGQYVYGKLGYKGELLSVGSTAMAIDYRSGKDTTEEDAHSNSFGLSVVQTFDKANIEAYLGYREYSLSETNASYRDASSVMFGARWKY